MLGSVGTGLSLGPEGVWTDSLGVPPPSLAPPGSYQDLGEAASSGAPGADGAPEAWSGSEGAGALWLAPAL